MLSILRFDRIFFAFFHRFLSRFKFFISSSHVYSVMKSCTEYLFKYVSRIYDETIEVLPNELSLPRFAMISVCQTLQLNSILERFDVCFGFHQS